MNNLGHVIVKMYFSGLVPTSGIFGSKGKCTFFSGIAKFPSIGGYHLAFLTATYTMPASPTVLPNSVCGQATEFRQHEK